MKKFLSLILVMVMTLSLAGCGGSTKTETKETGDSDKTATTDEGTKTDDAKEEVKETEGFELALITDVGTIDDKSFNQGSWEGLEAYAADNNITHKYYKPAEKSEQACLDAIALAVKGGAKTIVVPGFLFNVPIYEAQDKYPETNFVFIDGAPEKEGDLKIGANVTSIVYAEQEAGYLAGYAAVKEGNTKLGFMGGIAVPAVIKFGYGFVKGADEAGMELGKEIEIKYSYLGGFGPTPEYQALASSWYKSGTEVIFAAAGGAGNSVMKAAETEGTKVIGVDVDQSSESDAVLTSSMKNLSKSVYDELTNLYAGTGHGGSQIVVDASVEGVGLPMETSRFETFTQEDYDAIYAKLAAKEFEIPTEVDVKDATEIEVTNTTVTLVK